MLAECLRWYLRILFPGCSMCDGEAITYRLFFPSCCCSSSALKRYGITIPACSHLVPMSTGSLLSFWFCWIWGWIWLDGMMYSSFYCLLRTWLTEPGVMMKNPRCREEAPPEQTRSIYWFSLFTVEQRNVAGLMVSVKNSKKEYLAVGIAIIKWSVAYDWSSSRDCIFSILSVMFRLTRRILNIVRFFMLLARWTNPMYIPYTTIPIWM